MVTRTLALVIALLLLGSTSYAVEEKGSKDAPPKREKREVRDAPPVPPFSQVYVVEQKENATSQQQITTITDLFEIPIHVLEDYLKKQEALIPLLRNHKGLRLFPFREQFLQPTNYFAYAPSLPVLIELPYKVRRVVFSAPQSFTLKAGTLQQSQGGGQVGQQGGQPENGQVVFEDNYVFVIPPDPSVRYFAFVVVSEGGELAYFLGERATLFPNPSEARVIPHYRYVKKVNVPPSLILQLYYEKFKSCPVDGEVVELAGTFYKFRVKKHDVFTRDEQVFFCNYLYEVEKL